jgi:hypothetical protein
MTTEAEASSGPCFFEIVFEAIRILQFFVDLPLDDLPESKHEPRITAAD